jgi:hypothetical protein
VKSSSFQFFGLLFFFILVFEVNAGGNSTHFSGRIKNLKPGIEVQISTYNFILDDFQKLYKAKVSGLGIKKVRLTFLRSIRNPKSIS